MACFTFRVRYVWVIGLIGDCERGLTVYCTRNSCDFVRGYRVRGERRTKVVGVSTKPFKCDSTVSDYVFACCCDIVDLMRRGLW